MFLRPFLHLYPSQITGNADDLHWTVERRYTEFYNLEAKLERAVKKLPRTGAAASTFADLADAVAKHELATYEAQAACSKHQLTLGRLRVKAQRHVAAAGGRRRRH